MHYKIQNNINYYFILNAYHLEVTNLLLFCSAHLNMKEYRIFFH